LLLHSSSSSSRFTLSGRGSGPLMSPRPRSSRRWASSSSSWTSLHGKSPAGLRCSGNTPTSFDHEDAVSQGWITSRHGVRTWAVGCTKEISGQPHPSTPERSTSLTNSWNRSIRPSHCESSGPGSDLSSTTRPQDPGVRTSMLPPDSTTSYKQISRASTTARVFISLTMPTFDSRGRRVRTRGPTQSLRLSNWHGSSMRCERPSKGSGPRRPSVRGQRHSDGCTTSTKSQADARREDSASRPRRSDWTPSRIKRTRRRGGSPAQGASPPGWCSRREVGTLASKPG